MNRKAPSLNEPTPLPSRAFGENHRMVSPQLVLENTPLFLYSVGVEQVPIRDMYR
jgi:hypothetical protein